MSCLKSRMAISLFIIESYRNRGVCYRVLDKLEQTIKTDRIETIWTWTAEFEAPNFYKNYHYKEFCRMTDYYASGHSRIGLIKKLSKSISVKNSND